MLTYIPFSSIMFHVEQIKIKIMNSPRLYFPGLRPDDYFSPGSIIFKSSLLGLQSFKIVEKKDIIFYCVDQKQYKIHAFTYKNHEILSYGELYYIKSLIDRTETKLEIEECTPEQIYRRLSEKVKNGDVELVLFFHRLDAMFRRQQSRAKCSTDLIRQIKKIQV